MLSYCIPSVVVHKGKLTLAECVFNQEFYKLNFIKVNFSELGSFLTCNLRLCYSCTWFLNIHDLLITILRIIKISF